MLNAEADTGTDLNSKSKVRHISFVKAGTLGLDWTTYSLPMAHSCLLTLRHLMFPKPIARTYLRPGLVLTSDSKGSSYASEAYRDHLRLVILQ